MKIWFPVIRASSGSDVYVDRLVSALQESGVDAELQWFDRRYEYLPHLLRGVPAPAGTDLIHAISSWSGFAFARPPLPLVVTAFHCVYRNGYPQWKTRAQALYHDLWIGRLEERSFAAAGAVVALTPSAAEDFRTRFLLPRLHIIAGWVDISVFRPPSEQRRQDEKARILIVGNASKRKGIDLLPALVEQLGPQFLVTVIGGLRGGYHGVLPGVTFEQGLSVEGLVQAYQRADIVVSLSRYEGFGYSALEAMACGKPVVAFDAVGLRDVVVNGETGLLAELGDVAALAGLCKRLAEKSQEARAMGRAGRLRAEGHFARSAAVDSYVELYRGIVR